MSADVISLIGLVLRWLGLLALPLFLVPLIQLVAPRILPAFARSMSAIIDRITGGAMGVAIGAALVLIFAQLLVVVLRYAFALSFTWLNEIVIYAFAAMFMLGSAAALRDDAHVRVDILRPRFGAAGRNWVELAGIYLFLFPICIRLLTTGEQGLLRTWSLLEGSREADGLPLIFLFKTLVPAFAILMLAQGLSEALKAALRLTGQMPEREVESTASLTGGAHGA